MPGTKAFAAEIKTIEDNWHQQFIPEKGTLGYVIYRYRSGHRWQELKPATRASYDRVINLIANLHATPASRFTRPTIIQIRDEAILPKNGVWMANMFATMMQILLGFAFDIGEVKINPLADRLRRVKPKVEDRREANRPWTALERDVVIAEAKPYVRLVLALAMTTGLRKGDLFDVTFAQIDDGKISVRTNKRDRLVQLPIHPLLAEALTQRPESSAPEICVTKRGSRWTADGFDSTWHKFKLKLEEEGKVKPGLTLHGLRHTLGTLLKEMGVDDGDIADVLGQAGTSMARHYSRGADLPEAVAEKVRTVRLVGGTKEER
ncbi:MAG TPA: site-specific integrase [Defluviicoccus sp.]|nr:site-specific integrase [Defluviicoccus sp.]